VIDKVKAEAEAERRLGESEAANAALRAEVAALKRLAAIPDEIADDGGGGTFGDGATFCPNIVSFRANRIDPAMLSLFEGGTGRPASITLIGQKIVSRWVVDDIDVYYKGNVVDFKEVALNNEQVHVRWEDTAMGSRWVEWTEEDYKVLGVSIE
jgi:hypothetical protein